MNGGREGEEEREGWGVPTSLWLSTRLPVLSVMERRAASQIH